MLSINQLSFERKLCTHNQLKVIILKAAWEESGLGKRVKVSSPKKVFCEYSPIINLPIYKWLSKYRYWRKSQNTPGVFWKYW